MLVTGIVSNGCGGGNNTIPKMIEHMGGELIDGVEITTQKAGACAESLKQVQQLTEDLQNRNEQRYQEALASYNTAKANASERIANNHQLWADVCSSTPSACGTDMNKYFKKMNVVIGGYDIRESPSNGYVDCSRKCINDPSCSFFALRNHDNHCWLKDFRRARHQGHDAGVHIDGKWVHYPTTAISGWDFKSTRLSPPINWQNCANYSLSNGGNAFTYRHSDGLCWAQKFPNNDYNWSTGIKRTSASNFVLPDNHPMIGQTKPKRSDFPMVVNIPNIICQECNQAARNIDTEDSTNIDFGQVQSCIAGIEQAERQKAEQAEQAEQAERERLQREEEERERLENQNSGTPPNENGTENGSNTNPPPSSTGLSGGAIAGITIGGVVFLFVIGSSIYFMTRGMTRGRR